MPRLLPVLLVSLAVAGCARSTTLPRAPAPRCLELPGTSRASLRLAPDGKSLYWYEQVPFYGYGDAWPRSRVARWDLGDLPPRSVTDLAAAPFRVLPDGRVVATSASGVVVWTDGVSELVSEHDTIDHLELLGSGAAAIYASDGALWRQPLHRASATRFATADALVAVDGDRVVFWRGDDLVAKDAATGAERTLPAPDGELVKIIGDNMVVRRDDGLALQPVAGGAARTVLPGTWRTYLGPDGVRAWRTQGDRLEAAVIGAAGVERVPDVVGGDAIVGIVRLPDQRVVYLIGHDIDGDGDVTSGDEHDVCIGDGVGPLTVTPRQVPRHWLAAVPALDRLAAELGATGYHFASTGELPALTFTAAPAAAANARDRTARWRTVRHAGATATAALGHDGLNVIIEYDDGSRALSEWDTRAGKRVAWTGFGGAVVPDPTDYEVELGTETLARDAAGSITCAGQITNHTDRTLTGLVVDCVGGDSDTAIPVFPTSVPPGQIARFTGTTAGDADGTLLATVHRPESGENLLTYDRNRVARYERIAAAAAEVADRSRLTVWDWSGGVEIGVELWGPPDFTDYSDSARAMAAEIAYDVLTKVDRTAWLGEAGAPLALTIHAGGEVWTFDGKELTAGEN